MQAGPFFFPAGHTSPGIHLVWQKGHPGTHRHPPNRLFPATVGIFIADRLAKGQDIRSLPDSPILTLRIQTIPLPDILRTIPSQGPGNGWPHSLPSTREPSPDPQPSPGAGLSGEQGHSPRTPGGPASLVCVQPAEGDLVWPSTTTTLRKRVHRLRTLWDLRWHGENRATASHSTDPQVSACPICHRFWSQEHVLCGCPSSTDARLGGSLDLAITISRLNPGPMLDLGRHFQSLLSPQSAEPDGLPLVRPIGCRGHCVPQTNDRPLQSQTN